MHFTCLSIYCIFFRSTTLKELQNHPHTLLVFCCCFSIVHACIYVLLWYAHSAGCHWDTFTVFQLMHARSYIYGCLGIMLLIFLLYIVN